eukprot:SAG25_NODE_910_length_4794_cov_39.500319_3_plen_656_part_00
MGQKPPPQQQQLSMAQQESEQQRANQKRMEEALDQQQPEMKRLQPHASSSKTSGPTSLRTRTAQHSRVQSSSSSSSSTSAAAPSNVQAHQIAHQQMNWGRLYQDKTAAQLERLVKHQHQFEDQLHVINLTFNTHPQAKKRRATATLAELAAERSRSLLEKDLYNTMIIYMKRKGMTPDTKDHLQARTRSCSHDVRQFVEEQSYEYHAQRAANESVFLLHAQEDPILFEQQYAMLQQCVRKTGSHLKPELTAVLFPTFVHCFFDLLQLDTAERATNFLRKHRTDFDQLYGPDVEKLVLIREQAHLASSDIAQSFLRNQMTVFMCQDAFQLLADFLTEKRLALMLHTIYHYVDLQVYEGPPRSSLREDPGCPYVDPQPATRRLWGALHDQCATTHRDLHQPSQKPTAKLSPEPDASIAGPDSATGSLASKSSAVGLGTATKSGSGCAELAQLPASDADTSIKPIAGDGGNDSFAEIISTTSETETRAYVSDPQTSKAATTLAPIQSNSDAEFVCRLNVLRRKVAQTDPSLPSIYCYTFNNTQDSLHSLSFSRSGDMVAGGFADSSVRLWDNSRYAAARCGSTKRPSSIESASCCTLRGHAGPVYTTAFMHQEPYLLSASEDCTVRLWSVERGCITGVYQGHEQSVRYFVASALRHRM